MNNKKTPRRKCKKQKGDRTWGDLTPEYYISLTRQPRKHGKARGIGGDRGDEKNSEKKMESSPAFTFSLQTKLEFCNSTPIVTRAKSHARPQSVMSSLNNVLHLKQRLDERMKISKPQGLSASAEYVSRCRDRYIAKQNEHYDTLLYLCFRVLCIHDHTYASEAPKILHRLESVDDICGIHCWWHNEISRRGDRQRLHMTVPVVLTPRVEIVQPPLPSHSPLASPGIKLTWFTSYRIEEQQRVGSGLRKTTAG